MRKLLLCLASAQATRSAGSWQMTAPTARPSSGRSAARPGLRRGSLTPELIVDESLRLLDEAGRRRVQPAQARPRPRRGPDRGLPALRQQGRPGPGDRRPADRGGDGRAWTPGECWVDTLTECTRRLRAAYLAHPAAASLSACRTTQRPAEMRTVNILIGAVLAAGFEGPQAALHVPRARRLRPVLGRAARPRSWPWTSACRRPTAPPGPGPTWPSTGPSSRTSGRSA